PVGLGLRPALDHAKSGHLDDLPGDRDRAVQQVDVGPSERGQLADARSNREQAALDAVAVNPWRHPELQPAAEAIRAAAAQRVQAERTLAGGGLGWRSGGGWRADLALAQQREAWAR